MKPNIASLLDFTSDKTGRDFSICSAYAEPGYIDPDSGLIVFGNWNPKCGFSVPKDVQHKDPVSKLSRILEKCGAELEWSDEWSTCGDCGKAIRTSPDCYQWTPYYRILNDCELVCLDCLDAADYLESIEDDSRHCAPPQDKFNPELHGYVKHNGTFENGFHPGQNDNPAKILEAMHANGMHHVIFRQSEQSQFYIKFEAYYKPETSEE